MLRKFFGCLLMLVSVGCFAVSAGAQEWRFSHATSYASQGYEGPVPMRVYDVPTVNQRLDFGYSGVVPNVSFGLDYQRPETGSEYDDRLSFFLGTRVGVGLFDIGLEHRYIHTDTNRWLTGDGHMTVLQADVQSDGAIKPYLFATTTFDAENVSGIDDLTLFGGFGVNIGLVLPVLQEINLGFSIADSFMHNGDRMTLVHLSLSSEITIEVLDLTLIPQISVVRDVRDGLSIAGNASNPNYHWSITAPF